MRGVGSDREGSVSGVRDGFGRDASYRDALCPRSTWCSYEREAWYINELALREVGYTPPR